MIVECDTNYISSVNKHKSYIIIYMNLFKGVKIIVCVFVCVYDC